MVAETTFNDTKRMVQFLNRYNGKFVKCKAKRPDVLQIEAGGLCIGLKLPGGYQIFDIGDSYVLTNEEQQNIRERERKTFYIEFV